MNKEIKMKRYKTIILGCGASGAMCAVSSSQKDMAILDVASKPAKKILVTGNGRCNLTNLNMNSSFYNVNIDDFLGRFNEKKTLDFFGTLGLETYADEQGRVYPLTNSAKSVVEILSRNIKCPLHLGCKIEKIAYGCKKYTILTEKEEFECEKLVVALGGNCKELLDNLKIKYQKFVPSLVALKCDETRDLNGARVSDVLVSVYDKHGNKKSERGEVLFKENGISGIVVFNLSSFFARQNDFRGKIVLDLLPDVTLGDLHKKVEKRTHLNVNLDKMFVGMFENSVANEIFRQAKINTNKNSEKATKAEIERMCSTIKALQFEVNGAYENNQVYSGGVCLEDLTPNLESKEMKNLYVIGEAANVDGVCGGYNLQWAWTSGFIVGKQL